MDRYRHSSYDPFKAIIDLLGALVLIIVLSPLMIFVAMLIFLFYGSPIIFRQERLTRDGQIFVIYKFRSMTNDAEQISGAVWASKSDPRITPFGRILRFTRIDELPQIFNVLRGEMSLIGPRPERPEITEEIAKVVPSFKKRLAVKAGITGLAQIQTGYASSLESSKRKAAFDILYIKHRSLWLDFMIVVKTIGVMITGSGSR